MARDTNYYDTGSLAVQARRYMDQCTRDFGKLREKLTADNDALTALLGRIDSGQATIEETRVEVQNALLGFIEAFRKGQVRYPPLGDISRTLDTDVGQGGEYDTEQ